MDEIFYWVLNMSITATAVGVIVLLLRMIKPIPKRISVLLWLIPFSRMCLPFAVSSKYSLMTLLSKFAVKTVVITNPDVASGVHFSMMNSTQLAESYFPIVYKINILEDVFTVATFVWMTIFLAVLLTLAVLYFLTLREMRDVIPDHDNIYYSKKIAVPAVYGIFKPKIVLPESYKGQDVGYILRHEQAHIKRGDNLWRVLAFAVTAMHWFNPFAWLFLKLFLSDLELACDEKVLSHLDSAERREYARSLLNSRQSKNLFVSAFGGAAVRTRIENILSFRKMTVCSAIAFSALLVAVFIVLMTNGG